MTDLTAAAIDERNRIIEALQAADDDVAIHGSGTDLVTGEADVEYSRASEDHAVKYWVTVVSRRPVDGEPPWPGTQ